MWTLPRKLGVLYRTFNAHCLNHDVGPENALLPADLAAAAPIGTSWGCRSSPKDLKLRQRRIAGPTCVHSGQGLVRPVGEGD